VSPEKKQEIPEDTDDRIEQLIATVDSMRRELGTFRELLERPPAPEKMQTGAIERATDEFRKLPDNSEDALRWGFIGAWGKGGAQGAQHAAYSINTTSIDAFLDDTADEDASAFAAIFQNPHTIGICKHLFRCGGGATLGEIETGCDLSEEEFAEAIKPLLEWHFVEWKEKRLEANGQGVNFALTLIGMTKEGIKHKTNKWD
jgi:hypothetical protein